MIKMGGIALAALLAFAQGGAPISFENVALDAGVAKAGDPGAVAWADFDGDGDEDLFVATLAKNRVFRNDGDGRFTKMRGTGLEKGSAYSFGVAVGDYDNDGRLDLFVANLGSGNKLYHNEGGWRFRDVTKSASVGGGKANSYSAAFADFDRDGFLDLYVANGSQQQPGRNFLYRSRGDGSFEEVGERAGVAGNESSLGCAWGDYDDDGWPDLFVANFAGPNRLYHNDGDGSFSDRTSRANVADNGNGAGAAWGDYDNDGHLDLYLFNTNSGAAADKLYRNDGDGAFADVTAATGLREDGDSEAIVWGDFDNDGWLDLYLVNRSDFSPQRNRLWRNLGGARFADATAGAGVAGSGAGQPAAAADFDNDGWLDLYVGNVPKKKEELFRNRGEGGDSLVVRLTGSASNRAAIGARIRVDAGALHMTREISSSSGRSSQNGLAAHFGLGAYRGQISIEVRWPSGVVQSVERAESGLVEIAEPD